MADELGELLARWRKVRDHEGELSNELAQRAGVAEFRDRQARRDVLALEAENACLRADLEHHVYRCTRLMAERDKARANEMALLNIWMQKEKELFDAKEETEELRESSNYFMSEASRLNAEVDEWRTTALKQQAMAIEAGKACDRLQKQLKFEDSQNRILLFIWMLTILAAACVGLA